MSTTTRSRKTSPATKAKPRTASAAAKSVSLLDFDMRALLEKTKLPGVDLSGLIDTSRRDVEALVEANTQALRGLEKLNRRQAEILADTMKQLQAGAKELMSEEGATNKAGKAAELAQRAFGQALTNMKEIAEAAVKSQEETMRVLTQRHEEHMDALQKQLTPKG